MRIKYNVISAVLLIGIAFLIPQNAYLQSNQGMDVVLVIDSSGSMQKTDPLSLRVPAAKLFISLLEEGDRAGIVSFSDKGYPLSELASVDSQENKDKLFSAADRISAEGLYTNLYEAFNSGYGALSRHKQSGREKIMVLMSDGIMDVGNLDQDMRLLDILENSLTESIRKDNIRVYTIAFTEQSDRKLLERISKRTGGGFYTALTDKDFHGVFTSIFERLKSPEMIPMSKNGFVIDSSIEELTIVATKSNPETETQIISPNGDSYSSDQKYSGIGWFVSENFDMITIMRPLEGKWEILFSTGENNKAYVITNLKLQSDFDQMYPLFGEHMDVRMWLERDGEKVTESQVLDKIKVYIELTGPDGNTSTLQAFHKGEGIFLRTITPFTPGKHTMKMVAEGMTFERAKSFGFNVASLEESKRDLKEQRGEKQKHQEAGAGDEPEREASFITLFVQVIAINIIFGIIALCYVKREKVLYYIKQINVKDLMQSAQGLTKLIKRKQKGEEEGKEGEVPPDKAEKSGSPQSAEGDKATVQGNPAEKQVPQASAETQEQPTADSSGSNSPEEAPVKQEVEEIRAIEPQPEAETAGSDSPDEAPVKQESEEVQAIEPQLEEIEPEEKNQETPEKNMIALEEIEMEEKGKQEEALQEDKQQMIESLSEAKEDDQPVTASQETEIPADGEGQAVDTEAEESEDISLTPKESLDQPEEAPQEEQSEKGPEQSPEPEQTAESAAKVNVSDSAIEEMEEAMNQKQPPGEQAGSQSQDSTPPEAPKPDAEGDASSA